jgi:RNA polymerase sigma factor (sigma-70 family)
LVYAAALRQVRSPQLAEEVVQSVFTDLACNAGKLADTGVPPVNSLTPWLYAVTRRTAIDVIRKESRRQLREQIAGEMNHMNATASSGTGAPPVWSEIEPLLDDAMAALGEADRSAVLLRYFENKSLREVGEALGASEDAAQKRVSRAVERLREFFSRRNVTIGASGLTVLISANAVQSAPVGLAIAISTVALAGTAVHTSTVITATKAIAITTLQKTLVAATVTVLAGAGIYEARQASQLHSQLQTLQQQQAPLAEQIQQLHRERDNVTNRLASLLAENARLKSSPDENEMLRLRGEVTRLRVAQAPKNDPTAAAAKSWLDRVNQLKAYLDQHPDKQMPEFQFLSFQRWLNAVEAGGLPMQEFENPDNYYRGQIDFLRSQAESDFGVNIQIALRKYADASHGQFPTDLSQLRPYCDANAADILQQLYEIKPASILPASRVKELNIKTDWVVVRKQRAIPNSTSRGAYFAGGSVWWQSPPGRDDQ